MYQNCDFGFISWFQHSCTFNTDFPVSRLWWQWVMWTTGECGYPSTERIPPQKNKSLFFFWDGESISQNMERSTGNSKRILEMSYESPAVQGLFGKVCPSFPAHISGFCCQLRMSCCVYSTRSQVKKNNDLKREPVIITFGLSHK